MPSVFCLSGVSSAIRVPLTDYAHDHARGSGCGRITLYGVGVIDDACTSSIHTIQTVGQCITCAVHSELAYSVHHTGIIN